MADEERQKLRPQEFPIRHWFEGPDPSQACEKIGCNVRDCMWRLPVGQVRNSGGREDPVDGKPTSL